MLDLTPSHNMCRRKVQYHISIMSFSFCHIETPNYLFKIASLSCRRDFKKPLIDINYKPWHHFHPKSLLWKKSSPAALPHPSLPRSLSPPQIFSPLTWPQITTEMICRGRGEVGKPGVADIFLHPSHQSARANEAQLSDAMVEFERPATVKK